MFLEMFVALGLSYAAPLPPQQYRVDMVSSQITFTYPGKVDYLCGGTDNDGGTIMACSEVNGNWTLLPHPCLYPDDMYARLVCHELGHTSGWPVDHPNPEEYTPPQSDPQTHP